jgi:uncharacterized protein (DUF58 family)
LLFRGGADLYIPPRKGGKHALRVIREVYARAEEAHQGRGGGAWLKQLPRLVRRLWTAMRAKAAAVERRSTSIAAAMEFCQQVLPRRTVMFLISDFFDDGYLPVLRHAHRKHDLVGVRITDPREADMPPSGLVTLEDAETGRTRVVDTASAEFRAELAQAAAARRAALGDALRASGIDLIDLDATGSVVEPLLRFFRERARRSRR